MIELRATVAGIFFSKPARSGAATACVALGVGIVGSYVLGVGLSAMHAVAGLDHQQVGVESPVVGRVITRDHLQARRPAIDRERPSRYGQR